MNILLRKNNASKKKNSKPNSFKQWFSKRLVGLGKIGKSLLFPMATLPIAAILLRIGTQLPGGTEVADFWKNLITSGGKVMFNNLHIIFAVGIAFGLAKDNRGEAALAGFIGIALVSLLLSSKGADLTNIIYKHAHLKQAAFAIPNAEGFHKIFSTTKNDSYDSILSNNVLNGIIIGLLVAFIYNKFNKTELPTVLGFFSGRRLIPVLTVLSILIFGIFYSIVFPWVGFILYKISVALSSATGHRYSNAAIMGVYGTINRLLIPFGLHHIPNTLFWYTLPAIGRDGANILDVNQQPTTGDIFAFANGVAKNNTAGTFQSGFFPIMMFGLPALAAVFYITAENKVQKRRVLAIFGSTALVSFLTGITEPIEFAFMFVSPALFIMHAILTGIFGFITGCMGIQVGFGFSAGLLDFMLSIPKSMDIIHANREGIYAVLANPFWIFGIGALAFSTYFFTGWFLVKKFNIATPGRGTNKIESMRSDDAEIVPDGEMSIQAKRIVTGLGGWKNITSYANCATRLRYDIVDMSKIDEKMLKLGGAMGVMKVSEHHIQVIIGPKVEILNDMIQSNVGLKFEISKSKAGKVQPKINKNIGKIVKVPVMNVIEDGVKAELEVLDDGVFSKKMMGDGIVQIIPKSTKDIIIKAPIDGELITLFPTGHAYGIRDKNGIEILIHIGIDTVKLEGKGFKPLVKQGQKIKVGDNLVKVNVELLRKKGVKIDPIVLVTSKDKIIKTKKNNELFVVESEV